PSLTGRIFRPGPSIRMRPSGLCRSRVCAQSSPTGRFGMKRLTPNTANWFKRAAKQYFSSKDQLLTLGYAAFGPEFNTVEGNQADWKLAREVDARITIHVGVGTFGKNGKVAEVGKTGLYGPDTTFIHCTTLNDEEIQMIVDSGATVSLAS